MKPTIQTEGLTKDYGKGRGVFGLDFAVQPGEVFGFLGGDNEMFEREPMQRLLALRQMNAYRHTGFWKPMDTLRDNKELNDMWNSGVAPWKVW